MQRIRPTFKTAGITRLANITGLDRIGIPTTLAIRPNSQTLTTSSGKGFSLEAALTSGAMEAIELFHAEECILPSFVSSYQDLTGSYDCIPVENLSLTKHAIFNPQWPYAWTLGWDLIHQKEIPVPLSMVQMSFSRRRIKDLHTFQLTSNGLASGNNFLEAVNAGLFEVIERDGITCHRLAWEHRGKAPPLIRLETIEHPLVLDLMERLSAAQIGLLLYDCTCDTGIPIYMAYIYDKVVRQIGIYKGYGAHLDPEIAMIRAITEAVQGRVIYIAGSRDDAFRHTYLEIKRADSQRTMRALELLVPTADARQRTSEATATFEGDTLLAMQKLQLAGLHQVIVVDLSRSDFPVNVVKVIVPGLEGYMFDFYAPGPRAKQFLEKRSE